LTRELEPAGFGAWAVQAPRPRERGPSRAEQRREAQQALRQAKTRAAQAHAALSDAREAARQAERALAEAERTAEAADADVAEAEERLRGLGT
jgi:chromosome segregation ATPase